MNKELADFLALFGDLWELSLIASFFGLFVLYFTAKLKTVDGRANLFVLVSPEEMGGRPASAVYRKILTRGLDWFDRKWPAEPPEQNPGWRTAWSTTLYDKALLVAVVYPALSLVIYWAITNQDSRIGSLTIERTR